MEFEEVWNKITKHQNEIFYTKRGLEVKYTVNDERLYHNRTNPEIPKSHFLKAYKKFPLKGPGDINDIVVGSAYIYAILTDDRITGI
jgi:hypothetical protein